MSPCQQCATLMDQALPACAMEVETILYILVAVLIYLDVLTILCIHHSFVYEYSATIYVC